MKRMLAVVGRQLHYIAVENEARVRDTVGVAADGRAKEPPVAEITFQLVMPEHDVIAATFLVRHHQRLERRAERDDAGFKTVRCTKRHALDGPAIRQRTEYIPCNIWRCINHGQSSKLSTIRRRPSRKASATRRSGVRSTSLLPVAASSIKRR